MNGQVTVNGGVPLTNLPALDWPGYLYLAPGTYSVSLVPTGETLDHAFLGPLDVSLVAGHRYSLAALGQADDATHPPLLVDETAAYQAAGRSPTDFAHAWINNVQGAAHIYFSPHDPDRGSGAPYGGFAVGTLKLGPYQGFIVQTDDQIMEEWSDLSYQTPAVDQLDCFGGTSPDKADTHTAQYVTALDAITFLQSDTAVAAQSQGQIPSFSTFLAALQTTGLTDMLANGGPYMLFVPTDDAFAALPAAQRQALLAHPHALADVIRNQMVAGYYPRWSVGKGRFDRTVTNLLGTPLVLTGTEQLIINGDAVADSGDYVTVADGTRLFWTNKVLLPATQPANPPPGMPTTGAEGMPADLFAVLGAGLALLVAGGLLRRRGAGRR